MSTENEPIDIVIEPDKPAGDSGSGRTAAPPAEKRETVSADEGVDALQRQLERERQQRIAAENRALQSEQTLQQALPEIDRTRYGMIANARDAVRSETAQIKEQMAAALEAGDYKLHTELQERLAFNANRLSTLEQGLQSLEQKLKQPQPQQPVQQPVQQPADPVEAYISRFTEPTQRWFRQNMDYVRDPKKNNLAIAAHHKALAEGLVADTDDYFDFLNEELGMNRGGRQVRNDDDDEPPVNAAPVSRSTQSYRTGERPNVVRLSPEDREMARTMGFTEKEWASFKMDPRTQDQMRSGRR